MEAIPGADSSLAIMVHRIWCVEVGRRSISPRHREHIYIFVSCCFGGNTLTALSRPLAVKPAYLQALAIAKTMKPSAEAIWVKTQFKRSWPAVLMIPI
jgi:hypothetical protein